MIIAYHAIFTAYGFWLPNDPRGSWSDFVRSWELFRFGAATHTHSPKSVAAIPHDRQRRLAAKTALAHKPVSFSGLQCKEIGEGFKQCVKRSNFQILACSILPEHVHMVIGRHRYDVERVVGLLKGQATKTLLAAGLHPFTPVRRTSAPINAYHRPLPSPWARKCWKVFLYDGIDVAMATQYVVNNPMKEGLPRQRWSFVQQ